MILAFIGAELAGGKQILPPPLPVRVILDPIPGRGLKKQLKILAEVFVLAVTDVQGHQNTTPVASNKNLDK